MRMLLLILLVSAVSCTHSVYIVRHAEKAADNMSGDVALSEAGQQRAETLREALKSEKIAEIYSTNTVRTRSTAQPVADYVGQPVQTYGPMPDSAFISLLGSKKRNILVVGHSNTVDDIANRLCGRTVVPGDLPDSEYDNLFVVKVRGKKTSFERKKYGLPSR